MMQVPQTVLPLSEPDTLGVPQRDTISDLMQANQSSQGMLTRLVDGPLRPEPVQQKLGDPYVNELDRQIAAIFMPPLGQMLMGMAPMGQQFGMMQQGSMQSGGMLAGMIGGIGGA